MKISFVVPVYCVEAYIGQCIESLQRQTYRDIEIILVDDGSRDRSSEICEKYAEKDKRIKVIRQENQGVSVARNVGMEAAQGEWICFIDGDDAVIPSLCEDFLQYLVLEHQVCFFSHREAGNADFPSEMAAAAYNGRPLVFSKEDFDEFQIAAFNRDYPGKYDYHRVKLSTPCKFYQREFLLRHGIRFPAGVPTGEDCLFNLQVYRYAESGVYLDYEPYLHRVWGNSVSQQYNQRVYHDFSLLDEKLREYIASDSRPKRYQEVYAQRCIWSLGFCCVLNYCHPDNPRTYRERRAEFRRALSGDMGKAAMRADLNCFRLEKRVMFWLMKKKWFLFVELLCGLKRKVGMR